MPSLTLSDRISYLVRAGVEIPDPRQIYVSSDVVLDNIAPGSTIHPGCRLSGLNLTIGKGSNIGTEGPAILNDVAVDDNVEIASGYIAGSVLFAGARAGANSHIRPYSILEEGSSTAHCVGLKQTVLMSFVTTGSLINICDIIVSGGRSKIDHSEIGSGFIHFNFTPWGRSGDKATPTLVGNVSEGVFLDQDRVFLGGQSGIIGPKSIGFGSVIGAGQIVRENVPNNVLFTSVGRTRSSSVNLYESLFSENKYNSNIEFLQNLVALRFWYRFVRLRFARVPSQKRVMNYAMRVVDFMIEERIARLTSYLAEHGRIGPALRLDDAIGPPDEYLAAIEPASDYLTWIRSLDSHSREGLHKWLLRCATSSLMMK